MEHDAATTMRRHSTNCSYSNQAAPFLPVQETNRAVRMTDGVRGRERKREKDRQRELSSLIVMSQPSCTDILFDVRRVSCDRTSVCVCTGKKSFSPSAGNRAQVEVGGGTINYHKHSAGACSPISAFCVHVLLD